MTLLTCTRIFKEEDFGFRRQRRAEQTHISLGLEITKKRRLFRVWAFTVAMLPYLIARLQISVPSVAASCNTNKKNRSFTGWFSWGSLRKYLSARAQMQENRDGWGGNVYNLTNKNDFKKKLTSSWHDMAVGKKRKEQDRQDDLPEKNWNYALKWGTTNKQKDVVVILKSNIV